MNILSRAEAITQGRKFYFTGKSCPQGHVCKRLVAGRKCTACAHAAEIRRYHRDREAEKARSREHQRRSLPAPTRPCPDTCELCGRPPGKRALHLDHDHRTGVFRGWLCHMCNLSLGKFGDHVAGLQAAVRYLRRAQPLLPTESGARKRMPIASGVLDYFGSALASVAEVSFAGNEKHNPGQPLHWARGKSMDHADCIQRHFLERGTLDPEDGLRHSAKLAWRALALLQEELEAEGAPLARGAREPEGGST
jgi:hypothetical protein